MLKLRNTEIYNAVIRKNRIQAVSAGLTRKDIIVKYKQMPEGCWVYKPYVKGISMSLPKFERWLANKKKENKKVIFKWV